MVLVYCHKLVHISREYDAITNLPGKKNYNEIAIYMFISYVEYIFQEKSTLISCWTVVCAIVTKQTSQHFQPFSNKFYVRWYIPEDIPTYLALACFHDHKGKEVVFVKLRETLIQLKKMTCRQHFKNFETTHFKPYLIRQIYLCKISGSLG